MPIRAARKRTRTRSKTNRAPPPPPKSKKKRTAAKRAATPKKRIVAPKALKRTAAPKKRTAPPKRAAPPKKRTAVPKRAATPKKGTATAKRTRRRPQRRPAALPKKYSAQRPSPLIGLSPRVAPPVRTPATRPIVPARSAAQLGLNLPAGALPVARISPARRRAIDDATAALGKLKPPTRWTSEPLRETYTQAKRRLVSALIDAGYSLSSARARAGWVKRRWTNTRDLVARARNAVLGTMLLDKPTRENWRALRALLQEKDPRFKRFVDFAMDRGLAYDEAVDEWFSPKVQE